VLCIECIRYGESQKIDKAAWVGEDDSEFNFILESTGALPPTDILKKAFRILKQKIEAFNNELQASVRGSQY